MDANMIIGKAASFLKSVDGIRAIVLGGSRGRGSHTEKSDIDLGIYYLDAAELDLEGLRRVAADLDDSGRRDIITRIGEWGPWINGGGWLTIGGIATDFLFRDVRRVASVTDECLEGRITIDYQPGHPHGFANSIYAAETYYCRTLWDPDGIMTGLKKKLTPYPASMKKGTIDKFLWEAGFSCSIAEKGIDKGDIPYVAGCLYRAASCLVQVIYALNETFLMNEKGAIASMKNFRLMPEEFGDRIYRIFSLPASGPAATKNAVSSLSQIIRETESLV